MRGPQPQLPLSFGSGGQREQDLLNLASTVKRDCLSPYLLLNTIDRNVKLQRPPLKVSAISLRHELQNFGSGRDRHPQYTGGPAVLFHWFFDKALFAKVERKALEAANHFYAGRSGENRETPGHTPGDLSF